MYIWEACVLLIIRSPTLLDCYLDHHHRQKLKQYYNPNEFVTYLLTYLLTPYSRVLLEKLTGSATSQEIPRIFGTRSFLAVPTSARHLSLSWANSIQSPQLPPTFWRSILILSSHLRLGLPNGLPQKAVCSLLQWTAEARDCEPVRFNLLKLKTYFMYHQL